MLARLHDVLPQSGKVPEGVVLQNPVEEQRNCYRTAYSMTWAQQLKRVFVTDIEKFEKFEKFEEREKADGSVRINPVIANHCCAPKDEP